jgi:hypothetical protein
VGVMNQEERDELLALQRQLQGYLVIVEKQLLDYPSFADDADYKFLVDKAIMFRNVLTKIELDLDDNAL